MTITKIFLIGLMGSGKTYWGSKLAAHFHFPFLDLDKCIEATEQKNISEIFEQQGEEFFREKEKQTLHQLNKDHTKFVMSCGGGTPCFFDNMEWMKKNGVVIWLNLPVETLAERLLKAKNIRPLLKNASSVKEITDILSQQMNKRKFFYSQAHLQLEKTYLSINDFEKQIQKCIKDWQ